MNTDKKLISEANKAKLTEYIAVNPEDTIVLDGSIELLTEMGVGVINSVEVLDLDPWGWELLLIDNDSLVYYLVLTENGHIVHMSKDGSQGEALLSGRCSVLEPEPHEDERDNLSNDSDNK